MLPARGFFFDQDNACIRLTSTKVARDAQPDHATADDNEVARNHLLSIELHSTCDSASSNEAQLEDKSSIESLKMSIICVNAACVVERGGTSMMTFPRGRRINPCWRAIKHTRCPTLAVGG